MPISIAIVDNPNVSADTLAQSIRAITQYQIVIAATDRHDLFDQLRRKALPDIALVDLNLPGLDGIEIINKLNTLYPSVRVLAIAASNNREGVTRAMQHGAHGYLCRGCGAAGLQQALNEVMTTGRCVAGGHDSTIASRQPIAPASVFDLNNREYRFLKMACSELTYNEIADQMCVSPRTVDGYREMVFQKMSVRSRVGMVIKAVRHKLIEL